MVDNHALFSTMRAFQPISRLCAHHHNRIQLLAFLLFHFAVLLLLVACEKILHSESEDQKLCYEERDASKVGKALVEVGVSMSVMYINLLNVGSLTFSWHRALKLLGAPFVEPHSQVQVCMLSVPGAALLITAGIMMDTNAAIVASTLSTRTTSLELVCGPLASISLGAIDRRGGELRLGGEIRRTLLALVPPMSSPFRTTTVTEHPSRARRPRESKWAGQTGNHQGLEPC